MCEMCGRDTFQATEIEIEGARMLVCSSCSKHGKVVPKTPQKRKNTSKTSSSPKTGSYTQTKPLTQNRQIRFSSSQYKEESELLEDYGQIIRLARQKKELEQKDVAIQLKITISELQSIEAGKMRPTDEQIKKLEKFFEINITEAVKAGRPDESNKNKQYQTLCDIVVVKKEKK